MPQAKLVQQGCAIDYTPGSAKTAGDVVVIGNTPLVVNVDIAASALGALATEGVFDVVKITGAIAAGDEVHWNPTGDPVGGTAGSGAATITPVAGSYPMGRCVAAALSADTTVRVDLRGLARMGRMPVATVAAAGTNQATAAALVEGFNIVTGPDDTKGVILPTAVAGMVVIIKVGDGADLKVYPATGAAINAVAANGAMTVVDDVCFMLVATSATQWYTLPLLPS